MPIAVHLSPIGSAKIIQAGVGMAVNDHFVIRFQYRVGTGVNASGSAENFYGAGITFQRVNHMPDRE